MCIRDRPKTPRPPGMLSSTSSPDEQRYLPTIAETPTDIVNLEDISTTTAISGSGLQQDSTASTPGPSHREPASNPSWRLHPHSSQDARTTGDSIGPANDGILTAAVTTGDPRPLLTRTHPEPPAPTSSQGARTRNIAGSASPSEYTPVPQQFGDRVP